MERAIDLMEQINPPALDRHRLLELKQRRATEQIHDRNPMGLFLFNDITCG